MDYFLKEVPSWSDVFSYWERRRAPEPTCIEYDSELHDHRFSPWLIARKGRQLEGGDTVRTHTARHVAMLLPERSPDDVAAYKMEAVATCKGLDQFRLHVLHPFWKKVGDTERWWHHSARHVLPFTSRETAIINRSDWKEIVDLTADVWIDIAETYQIIRLPQWYSPGTPQRESYERALRQYSHDVDRRDYERLRAKLEGEASKSGCDATSPCPDD